MQISQFSTLLQKLTSAGQRPTIGLLISDVASFWGSPTWWGVRSAAKAYGVNLLTFSGGYLNSEYANSEMQSPQGNYLYELAGLPKLDGFVVVASGLGVLSRPEEEVNAFCGRLHPRPMVALESPLPGKPCLHVSTIQSLRDIITHLLDVHGYQRIAFYRLDVKRQSDRHIQRYHIYREMLEARGLFDPELVFTEKYENFPAWLQSKEKAGIQAILGNDGAAAPGMRDGIDFVLETLQDLGYRVPEDIAVTAFSDDPELTVVESPVTTMRFPYYELGYQATEQVLKLMVGESIPESTTIQAPVLIRESCGCKSHRMESVLVTTSDEILTGNLRDRRETIVAAICDSLPADCDPVMVKAFFDSFVSEIEEAQTGAFLSMLKRISNQERQAKRRVDVWQDAISVFRHQVLPGIKDQNLAVRAENIWQQGRLFFSESQQRSDAARVLQADRFAQQLRAIGQELSHALDIGSIMDILATRLPSIDLHGAYVCLYEDPKPYVYPQAVSTWSRLVLAFDETGRRVIDPNGLRFETKQLLPPECWIASRPYEWVIEPLFVQKEQFGYVIFESGPYTNGEIYYTLQTEISNALYGARLLQQVRERSADLARRAAQLDAAAQVARVTTSILNLNQLLGESVELIRKGLNLYYVGLFLVDGEYALLRAGTGEAGQALLARNHFLPLDEYSMIGSAITTGEARIALSTESDIVRFINPLLPDTRSEMALPIRHKDKVLGALTIQATEVNAFTPADVTTLSTIADQLGNAIANAQLVSGLEGKQAEIETMYNQAQQTAAELKISRDAATAANRAKSEFLANMSHELRTPLNGILGYAQILKSHKNLTPQQLDGLDIIYKSGDHLLTLINDILDIAKIEARRFELILTPVNLPEFLHGLVALVRTNAERKDLPFYFETTSNLPTGIMADEKRLRQVLLNLLSNAIKFTTYGNVTLRAGCVGAYLSNQSQYRLRFEVQDTGPGMSPESAAKLFKAFEQVGDSMQRAQGTGLGLAISQSLVQAMGGDIQLHSVLDQGSTFWFELDFASTQMGRDHETQQLGTIVGYTEPRRKLLLVDDNTFNRAMLVNLLSPLGFDLAEADNGRQGVEQAQVFQPDLILMDLAMPGMRGDEATRIIRQYPELQKTVIVIASASAFEEDRKHAANVGANDFITKPINIQELLRLLEKHLHLVWQYDAVEAQPTPVVPAEFELIPPPDDEIMLLYDLAMRGDVTSVQKRLTHIETLGTQYHPFAAKLRELAKNFDVDAIEALIEKFRK